MDKKYKIMKKVIQIIEYKTEDVVKEIDVTGKSQSQIDKIERGLNRNLNHDEYYTSEVEK